MFYTANAVELARDDSITYLVETYHVTVRTPTRHSFSSERKDDNGGEADYSGRA